MLSSPQQDTVAVSKTKRKAVRVDGSFNAWISCRKEESEFLRRIPSISLTLKLCTYFSLQRVEQFSGVAEGQRVS